MSSTALIQQAFTEIAAAGTTVVRTWGFNDVTSASGTYYQLWNGATPTINTGATGLGQFDIVVAQAKAAGIKLVVALTNNWDDYGGMSRCVESSILAMGKWPDDLLQIYYTNCRQRATPQSLLYQRSYQGSLQELRERVRHPL